MVGVYVAHLRPNDKFNHLLYRNGEGFCVLIKIKAFV